MAKEISGTKKLISVVVDEKLYERVKIYCIINKKTVKEFIALALDAALIKE